MKRGHGMRQYGDREGQALIDWVEAGLKLTNKNTAKNRT
jgi:hypothetical protein